jgi:hypothetical protein
MDVIIFQTPDGVALLQPFTGCGLSVLDIGKKDVFPGSPFWITDSSTLPVNQPQVTWELDTDSLGDPDGYGGTYIQEAEKGNDE